MLMKIDPKRCVSCGSEDVVAMAYPSEKNKWTDLQVIVCNSCGFGFVPTLEFDLGKYYRDEYGETHARKRLKPAFFQTIDSSDSKKVKRSKYHAETLNALKPEFDRVLDIGAGPGFFLHYIKARKKFAIESDALSQPMLKSVGAKTIQTLDDEADFDLIVMSHVLEHFTADAYRDFLEKAYAKLRAGGLLLVEVPQWAFLNREFEKKNGAGHDPHTLFFSPKSFLRALDEPLIYFHDKSFAYGVANGAVDWSARKDKPNRVSSMLAIWRKD